ncbi:hypothetical protein AHAS_Ahas04G0152300 [Arachis hypogaea]
MRPIRLAFRCPPRDRNECQHDVKNKKNIEKKMKKKSEEPVGDEANTARLQNEGQHDVKKKHRKKNEKKWEEPAGDEAITARLQVSSSG